MEMLQTAIQPGRQVLELHNMPLRSRLSGTSEETSKLTSGTDIFRLEVRFEVLGAGLGAPEGGIGHGHITARPTRAPVVGDTQNVGLTAGRQRKLALSLSHTHTPRHYLAASIHTRTHTHLDIIWPLVYTHVHKHT